MIPFRQTTGRARWQDARDVVDEQMSVGTLVVGGLASVPNVIPGRAPLERVAWLGAAVTPMNARMPSSLRVATMNVCLSTLCRLPHKCPNAPMRVAIVSAPALCIMESDMEEAAPAGVLKRRGVR